VKKESTKKPDQIVWNEKDGYNAALLPYATNVGAPAIVKEDIDGWKQRGVNRVNHQLKAKFEELKAEYQQMIEELQWNELVYSSKFSFEPVIGEEYHLYVGDDGNVFLSLIEPYQWKRECIGSFRLNSEQKWMKI
jgi:hypothetical protein